MIHHWWAALHARDNKIEGIAIIGWAAALPSTVRPWKQHNRHNDIFMQVGDRCRMVFIRWATHANTIHSDGINVLIWIGISCRGWTHFNGFIAHSTIAAVPIEYTQSSIMTQLLNSCELYPCRQCMFMLSAGCARFLPVGIVRSAWYVIKNRYHYVSPVHVKGCMALLCNHNTCLRHDTWAQ